MQDLLNLICALVGKLLKPFVIQHELIYRDTDGNYYVVANPEVFLRQKDPFSYRCIVQVKFNRFGLYHETDKVVTWHHLNRPDNLIPINSMKKFDANSTKRTV